MASVLPAWTLKTAPTVEPVTLDEFKAHARITHDSEDAMLAAYLMAARQWIEAYTQRSLVPQTWQLSMPEWAERVWLPRAAPLSSVTHVKYYDASNVLQTWSSSNYLVPAFQEPALVQRLDTATWPSLYDRDDAVQIEYVTGYANGACPEALRLAVLTLATHHYENREAVMVGTISKEVEFSVTALCGPYRVFWRAPEWR